MLAVEDWLMQYLPGSLEATGTIAEEQVWDFLVSTFSSVSGSCGYKLPSAGVGDDFAIPSFVLILPSTGVVLIDVLDEAVSAPVSEDFWRLANGQQIPSRDVLIEQFANQVEVRLKEDLTLYDRAKRSLKCPIHRLLVFYRNSDNEVAGLRETLPVYGEAVGKGSYQSAIYDLLINEQSTDLLQADAFDRVIALLDGTNNLLPKRQRVAPEHPLTKRDFLDISRSQIFKLDEEQRPVSLQIPNGPQRIRGLAGTGKTVILSLKAALTHKSASNYRILYLFNTKSLYDIVRSHISKYYIPEAKREPDWTKIDVLHAWGGRTLRGLYFDICQRHNIRPVTYDDIRNEPDQIGYIYNHLLASCKGRFEPYYDLALIDEAQDFPPALFEVVYHITRDPKRIVWAYDEFQTLSDTRIPEPEELFGTRPDGKPNVSSADLRGEFSKTVRRDYVLPNSYRTSRVNLVVAHGLALGIKNPTGFIDMIDDRGTWKALGYDIIEPADGEPLVPGTEVEIVRPEEHSKNILESTLRRFDHPDKELLSVKCFENKREQIDFVASEIDALVREQDIQPEEIMVVTIEPRDQRNTFTALRKALSNRQINCITPGIYERAEVFRTPGAVTLVSPFRAKGNEADVVFVIDAQAAVIDLTFRARNFLFVSMTRARGWCYVSGSGKYMSALQSEIEAILADYPRFDFKFPTDDDIKRRRLIMKIADESSRAAQLALQKIAEQNPELLDEFIRQRNELFAESMED